MNLYFLNPVHLFFAERLLVPAHGHCGRPAGAVVARLRERHFMVPAAPKWRPGAKLPADGSPWAIVIGRRAGPRSIRQSAELELALAQRYGAQHVRLFLGNETVAATRELFATSLLYVGPHGAGLANVMLARPGTALLEIRPLRHDNPCYHYLADRCKVEYYLLRGDGNFTSAMDIKVPEVVKLINDILPTS
eukprot:SM000176S03131  [mRNA]  locus=s176:148933:149965:+ [translate_table: standard]